MSECSYTSLCRWCSSISSCNAGSSGKNCAASPVSTITVKPSRGFTDIKVLTNSSLILSDEIICNLADISVIAVRTSGAIAKPSCAANRAARIIRSGSSLKDCSGVPGVRNCFAIRSCIPLCGSIKRLSFPSNSKAIALTVKSLLLKSPSRESPYCTSGLRLSLS